MTLRRFSRLGSRLILCVFLGVLTLAPRLCAEESEAATASEAKMTTVYVGTYTRGESEGIYRFELDPSTGEPSQPRLVAETVNPSFLALHPSGKWLYAVNEIGDFQGQDSGATSAFAIDAKSGELKLLNQQPSLGGAPCHLTVDDTGQHVLAANYSGGSVISLPIQEDGRLGSASSFVQHKGSSVNPRRQKGPHAHSINLDRNNRFAVAADLGLDKLLIYRFDSQNGKLTPNDPPFAKVVPGAGPRHFAFHPHEDFAYVINELDRTVTAFDYDPERGALSPTQTISTVPEGFNEGSTADVHVHPSGRFLYGSNRGHDSIAVFRIDPSTGKLSLVEIEPTQGRTPRNFGIDPSGRFLLAANQASDNIVIFRIDSKSGELSATGHQVQAPTPVCVRMR